MNGATTDESVRWPADLALLAPVVRTLTEGFRAGPADEASAISAEETPHKTTVKPAT